MRIFISTALVASLSACNAPNIVVGELHDTIVLPAMQNRNLDLLFVIDDSPSMLDKQVALANAFPLMIDVLSELDGGLPNLHIGVVTSDMGTSASESQPGPAVGILGSGGCAGTGKGGDLVGVSVPFLSDIEFGDGTRERNYTGALRDAFSGMAQVGANGCGFEQHLSAMWHALDNNPSNVGFIRPHANLGVVILADEDDCSLRNSVVLGPESATLGPLQSFRCFRVGVTCDEDTNTVGGKANCRDNDASLYIDPVEAYVDRLISLKDDERRVMVGVIAGDPEPVAVELRVPPGGGTTQPALAHSCTIEYPTGPSVADPGVRLQALVDAFPGRATFSSICSTDLTPSVAQIAKSAKGMMGDPCLDSARLADVAPDEPGVQPSCEVLDIADSAPNTKTSLATCSSGAPDCYELVPDATACPGTEDHLRVRLNRVTAVSADTWTYVRCKRSE